MPREIIKIEKYADNGEFSHFELTDKNTGEILWYSGTPKKEGRYIVVYKYKKLEILKAFIADFNEIEDKWICNLPDIEIVWWNEIPPFIDNYQIEGILK